MGGFEKNAERSRLNAEVTHVDSTNREQLGQRLAPYGQQHLVRFWDELDDRARQRLAGQIEGVDLALVDRLYRGAAGKQDWGALARRAQEPDAIRLRGRGNRFSPEEAKEAGEAALRRGEVGTILVAGGQGTRLGFNRPKGMYKIGPVSEASLFQILFEKVLATSRRYGHRVPLYVMTSDATHADTDEYLKKQNYFGLASDDVRLFCQGTMPAVDAETGRLLLAEKGQLALSPDGHGGMLAGLASSGALADIERRGIKHLFYFQVDNPLAKVCDPAFLGYHLLARSEMTTLAVAKRDPLDRVGNVVKIDGRLRIIEYSDLPEEAARKTDADGNLRIWAGSIAVHAFDVAFLRRSAERSETLPFHTARKKVAHVDDSGNCVEPTKPNAIKFERFIFDLLPAAERAIVVEGDPAEWFSAVKNPPGEKSESPDTCRSAMSAMHRKWLEAAGVRFAADVPVEISPLVALDPEELKDADLPAVIDEATYFGSDLPGRRDRD
jgi:UDP-N-acetylglucosamine/UDP-N-acetylgalactosamine diphosphorylase